MSSLKRKRDSGASTRTQDEEQSDEEQLMEESAQLSPFHITHLADDTVSSAGKRKGTSHRRKSVYKKSKNESDILEDRGIEEGEVIRYTVNPKDD